jgi:hypothetical protein
MAVSPLLNRRGRTASADGLLRAPTHDTERLTNRMPTRPPSGGHALELSRQAGDVHLTCTATGGRALELSLELSRQAGDVHLNFTVRKINQNRVNAVRGAERNAGGTPSGAPIKAPIGARPPLAQLMRSALSCGCFLW